MDFIVMDFKNLEEIFMYALFSAFGICAVILIYCIINEYKKREKKET